MSGICAVWRRTAGERAAEAVSAIAEGMSLIAEEQMAACCEREAGVAAVSRRAEQQVFETADLLVACEADLSNAVELCEQAGCDRSAQMPALLAALYQRFGCDFVERLRGSFSVVLWDRREKQMLAAIDAFGMRRLAYYETPRLFLISSRADALPRSGEVDTEVNPRAIANVLNFSVNLGPETILTKVRRLAPGTMLIASQGQLRLKQYWDMRYSTGRAGNEARLSRELESVVEAAVAENCKGLEPSEIGAFLSGGTDSSTVVGMMDRIGQGPVKAFSIGFQEQSFNELGYAEITARKFQAKHYTYLVGPDDCFAALPRMVRYFDEPFGNSSAIPTYFCARLAAENGVRVLLAGDGGDELFGGNERYATDKIFETYHAVPKFLRHGVIEPVLDHLPPRGLLRRARNYVRRANMPPVERFISFQFLSLFPPREVFDGDFCAALGDYSIAAVPARYYAEAPAHAHLDRLLYLDVKITLGDSDLPKVTQMCELAGVQPRFPFLNRGVAEFSGRIPARLKVKGFDKRYLFKKAFRELLPREVIQKKKHGFGIPVADWLRADPRFRELSRDVLLSRRAFERGYFRRAFIEDLFRRLEADESSYYGDTLWTFLVLELWQREVIDHAMRAAV